MRRRVRVQAVAEQGRAKRARAGVSEPAVEGFEITF